MTRGTGDATRVAESGFLAWIDRVIALTCLAATLVAMLLAADQFDHVGTVWLMGVGGALLAASVLLPVYAWSQRGMRAPGFLYAAAVAVGLWTWPLVWSGPTGPGHDNPWLWPCIGVSTVLVGITLGNLPALGHNLVCAVGYLVARLNPVWGVTEPLAAVQDTLAVAGQPLLVLFLFGYVRREVATLDAWVAAARRQQADAAVRASLVDERARLDAVIHDEVMTTLVAAARSPGRHDQHVTDLARRTIATLNAQGEGPAGTPFHPANVARLLRDVAASVNPGIRFDADVDDLAPLLPEPVVEAMARAVREAVGNAERHAAATVVSLSVAIAESTDGVHLRVEVVDDGVGFDPGAVPERRLGIRLSLRRRLRSVGGDAEVDSTPGRGTRVTLTWDGVGADATSGPATPTREHPRDHPVLRRVDLGPIALVAGAGATLYTAVALLDTVNAARPGLTWVAVALLCIAVPISLRRFGQELARWQGAVVVALGLGVTALCLGALPAGPWPVHGTALVGTVCILVVLLRAGGRRVAAWVLAVAAGAFVLAAAVRTAAPLATEVGTALTPLGWLVCCEMLIVWILRVQRQLDLAQRATDEASAESAASFARLVVREVWLAEVRDQVGGLLDRLADPEVEIGTRIRDACLAAEGGLRDRIKAANFTAPSLAAAIMRARLRGVAVTLVDNRAGSLDEGVRRVALRHLEGVVEQTRSGRIVARVTPDGYPEAVTIVHTGSGGSALTRINDDGTIVVSET